MSSPKSDSTDTTESAPAPAPEPAPASQPVPVPGPSSPSDNESPPPPPTPQQMLQQILEAPISNENDALNILIGFLSIAQKRGAFEINESAKIFACIKKFQKNSNTD